MWIIEPQAGIFEASKEASLRGLTSQLHHRTKLTKPGGTSQNQELGLLMSSLETGSGQPMMGAVVMLLSVSKLVHPRNFVMVWALLSASAHKILFAQASCSSSIKLKVEPQTNLTQRPQRLCSKSCISWADQTSKFCSQERQQGQPMS